MFLLKVTPSKINAMYAGQKGRCCACMVCVKKTKSDLNHALVLTPLHESLSGVTGKQA